jgi:hypothetical protein
MRRLANYVETHDKADGRDDVVHDLVDATRLALAERRARDAPVVQYIDAAVRELIQTARDAALPGGAPAPGRDVLRFVGQRKD